MNIIKTNTLISIFIFLVLASCSKDNYDEGVKTTPIIYGEVEPYNSGNADLIWPSGQKLGIYMLSSATSEEIYSNVAHTASVLNNTFVKLFSTTTMYFPESGDNVDFIFYAPYKTIADQGIISVSTTNQSVPTEVDLLYASGSGFSKANSSVPLKIEHQFTKLLFKVEAVINSQTVSIKGLNMRLSDIVSSGTFNLKTATLVPDSKKSSFNLLIDDNAVYQASAIVLPTSSTDDILLEVTVLQSGKTYVSNISDVIKEFKPSTLYVFNVKLTDAGLNITLGSSIEDWENDNGGGEGIIVDKENE